MIVKDLSVTVTYRVGLGNIEMPENVYNQITEAEKNGHTIEGAGLRYSEASEWLSDNIKEHDCFEWETEIDEIHDGK